MRLPTILLLPALALSGQYSGTVKDLAGTAVPGTKVSIGSDSTMTDSEGKWSLSILSTRVAKWSEGRDGSTSPALRIADGHLSLAWEGADIQGRRIANSLPRTIQGTSIAARTSAIVDTLVVAWKGKRLVRLQVTNDSSGIAFAIDTAWRDDFDIPWNPRISYGSVKDSLGRTYRTVKMGKRTWMAENLAIEGRNAQGDTLGMCNGRSLDSCEKYGRLYTWPEALVVDSIYNHRLLNTNGIRRRGICPTGWLVPTEGEWIELLDHVDPRRENDAKLLRSTRGWTKNATTSTNGMDAFGFRVLSASYFNTVSFQTDGTSAGFWTLTEVLSTYQRAFSPFFTFVATYTLMDDGLKPYSFSMRCVKDTL